MTFEEKYNFYSRSLLFRLSDPKKHAEFDDKNCDSYAWIRRTAKEALEAMG